MIIDRTHRVAFVHVPKSGGTSVSLQMAGVDSYRGAFRRKGVHAALGPIHYAHIPLDYLGTAFPEVFREVEAFESFALVRDPFHRFGSAVFQRLDEFRGSSKLGVTRPMVLAEARSVIGWLEARGRFCDLPYIHFRRQVDFISLGGRRIVRHVFPLENIAELASALSSRCGLPIDPGVRENTNFAGANDVMRALHRLKPIYSRLTSWPLRSRILHLLKSLRIQEPAPLYEWLTSDPEVRSFIETYYEPDFRLVGDTRASVGACSMGSAARADRCHTAGAAQPR